MTIENCVRKGDYLCNMNFFLNLFVNINRRKLAFFSNEFLVKARVTYRQQSRVWSQSSLILSILF